MSLEVLGVHRRGVVLHRLLVGVAHHFREIALRRFAQLLSEAFELLGARALAQGLAQLVLGGPQILERFAGVAVLDGERQSPQPCGDVAQLVVVARLGEFARRAVEIEIDARARLEQVGPQLQRSQGALDAGRVAVGIEHEVATQFDKRLGERIDEGSLRQNHFDRRARRGRVRHALGRQRQRHPRAGPGMFGKIDGGARLARSVGAAGKRQRQRRRPEQGMRGGGRLEQSDAASRLADAIGVLDGVMQGQRARVIGLRWVEKADRRRRFAAEP